MRIFALGLTLVLSGWTHAAGAEITFDNAWSRATVPGAKSAAVYGTIANTGDRSVEIEAVSSDVANMAMIHETVREGDMMRMRHMEDFTLAPGEAVELYPGRMHVMLMGLSGQLNEGDNFEIEIKTSDGNAVTIPVTVGAIGQMTAP